MYNIYFIFICLWSLPKIGNQSISESHRPIIVKGAVRDNRLQGAPISILNEGTIEEYRVYTVEYAISEHIAANMVEWEITENARSGPSK